MPVRCEFRSLRHSRIVVVVFYDGAEKLLAMYIQKTILNVKIREKSNLFLWLLVFIIYLHIFSYNHLLKSIICVILEPFSLLKHDACMVVYVNDILVGQIGVKGQADFPTITDNNCLFNLKIIIFMKSVDDLVCHVWTKGKDVPGRDKSVWRFDDCGALIRFNDYGKQSEYGWEIDHIIPKAKGGSDDISNLQPLQWENNRAKSDGYEIPKVRNANGHNRVVPFYGILLS